jgi:hypothetical protein
VVLHRQERVKGVYAVGRTPVFDNTGVHPLMRLDPIWKTVQLVRFGAVVLHRPERAKGADEVGSSITLQCNLS